MSNTKKLNSKIGILESHIDVLESELSYLNNLLVECGFNEGIQTLKATVEELLSSSPSENVEDGSQPI